ncbi:MAG: ABC transporter permease [Terriglobales bacterium]
MLTLTPWIAVAARWLRRRPARAAAMVAGLAVGIALLTAVAAAGAAAQRATLAQVRNMLGTFDTVLVRPGGAATRGMVSLTNVPPTLSFDDAAAVAQLPAVAQVALLQNAFDIEVDHRDRQDTPAVFGVSANWLDLRGDALSRGGFFTPEQMRSEARVAVLGADVVDALFAGADPVGQSVRLGGEPYRVEGVLARRGAGPGGFSLDHLVLIPLSTARHRLFNRDFLTMVVAQLRHPGQSAAALATIRRLLRQRHHVAAAALDDFTLTDPRTVAEQLSSVRSRLDRLVEGAGWVAEALGSVAVLALMLLSVLERRTEIAIRRAAGARPADILAQFLTEAALLGVAAMAAGGAAGLAAVAAIARWQRAAPAWPWGGLAQACAAALLLALLAGAVPALLAARMAPAAALRS